MGHIFCLMGKSSSGKDTIYTRLMEDSSLHLRRIIIGTTRPIRSGEQNGREYYFYTKAEMDALEQDGRIIESRAYHTVHGIWYYFTVADDSVDLMHHDYLLITTLEAYKKMAAYYGAGSLVPIYLEVDDGLRLMRALQREQQQAEPKYAELCRRFLADEADFSEENRKEAGVDHIFYNRDLEETVRDIRSYITHIG